MSSAADTVLDVLVAGGGPVGASLACALGGAGLRVAVVEAVAPGDARQPSYDERPLALAYGSRRILEGIGAWPALADRASPIRRIHVSHRGHFGATRLDARDHDLDALGYVVPAHALGGALAARLADLPRVEHLCPAAVEGLRVEDDCVRVAVRAGRHAVARRARLVVAADGGRSQVRRLLGIGERRRDYGQAAVTANVTPARPHGGTAYERFTPAGPIALLPLTGGRCGLVWTCAPAEAKRLVGLDEAPFLSALGAAFGMRLGPFLRAGARSHHPLVQVRAAEQARARVAIIGNAAHTLHPIAGQGFNLGLRDVAALADAVADAHRAGADPGARTLLEAYARARRLDQNAVTLFTDALLAVFGSRLAPVSVARGLGLVGLDLALPLKRGLGRAAMGLAGRQPRLALGRAP